ERKRFFFTWSEQRADAIAINGVYLFLCRTPRHFGFRVTPKAISAFGVSAVEELRSALAEDLHGNRYDDGLLGAIKFVRERLVAYGQASEPNLAARSAAAEVADQVKRKLRAGMTEQQVINLIWELTSKTSPDSWLIRGNTQVARYFPFEGTRGPGATGLLYRL